jgi:iron complex outermembrane recepter protein
VTNVFLNYTIKNASWLRGSKLGLAVNNLIDSHNIVGVTPAVAPTAATPYVYSSYDQINILPGRSIIATFAIGYAPRK